MGDTAAYAGSSSEGFWQRINANHPLVFRLEWLLGTALACASLITLNFALLTIASCLILSPLLGRYGWENRAISALVSLPLLFVPLAFAGMGLGLLGMQGFSMYYITLQFF